jgi:hypothetical protein
VPADPLELLTRRRMANSLSFVPFAFDFWFFVCGFSQFVCRETVFEFVIFAVG